MPAKNQFFSSSKPVIGMIHLEALPGTPASRRSVREIESLALREAKLYREEGVHGIMIENMHDTPYLRSHVGPEIVATMAIVASAVKGAVKLPCGVQVLAGANTEAMAVAHAAGLDFIRVEGFAFAHVADEGLIQASAAPLLRYRKQIGADHVQVWADVKKKHSSHAITADIGIGETAEAVEFMRGDAVIITGSVTGDPPQLTDIRAAKKHSHLPIYLGSGVTAQNLAKYYALADGFIVGSHFKIDGRWSNAVDAKRIAHFMKGHGQLER
ncbi:MAG TPA: BtpA/SgcQ family protein [Verrucomicrobiae bacterium]|nr:BtpA/SgcQ family protein [Verrucomicrobiae bacterium]